MYGMRWAGYSLSIVCILVKKCTLYSKYLVCKDFATYRSRFLKKKKKKAHGEYLTQI